MEELRDVNNLNYKIPISADVVAQASMNTYNFNPNQYDNIQENDIMQVDFQEGKDYIDPQNSYIRLKLNVTDISSTIFSFGKVGSLSVGQQEYYESDTGESILNLIKHVELVTKNGECIFKENFKNEMGTLRNYKINLARKQNLSFMGGYSQVHGFPFFGTTGLSNTFYIPLCEISTFFHSTLIPYKLLSESVLRLTLADPRQSVYLYTIDGNSAVSAPISRVNLTANISNVALILSEKQLYPEVNEAINKKINSPDGLQYSYYTNHTFPIVFPTVPGVSNTQQPYTIPINLSVAKIKYIAIKPTPIKNFPPPGLYGGCYPSAKWDSFLPPIQGDAAMPFKIKIRLGNDVLSTYNVETIPELYEQTSKALANISFADCHDVDLKRTINKKSTGCLGYHDYFHYQTNFLLPDGIIDPTIFDTSGLVFAFDFERTKALGVSGVSTNMERLLEIDILDYQSDAVGDWYVSIQYLAQADLFADGSIAINK